MAVNEPTASTYEIMKVLDVANTFIVPHSSSNASRSRISKFMKDKALVLPQLCASNKLFSARCMLSCLLHVHGRIDVKLFFFSDLP